jgi:hypothetical protein
MRRGSMRNVSPRGFASLVEVGVAPADKPERSDLFNPTLPKILTTSRICSQPSV